MREPYAGAAQRVEAGRIVGVGDVDALHGAAVAAVLIPDHRPVRVPVPRLDHQSVTIALDLTREPETQLPVGRFVEALVLPLEVVARLAEELIALRRAVGIHRVVPEVAAELRHVVLRDAVAHLVVRVDVGVARDEVEFEAGKSRQKRLDALHRVVEP